MLLAGQGGSKAQGFLYVAIEVIARTVPVDSEHVDVIVAGVALQVFFRGIHLICIIGIKNIMEPLGAQIVYSIPP